MTVQLRNHGPLLSPASPMLTPSGRPVSLLVQHWANVEPVPLPPGTYPDDAQLERLRRAATDPTELHPVRVAVVERFSSRE